MVIVFMIITFMIFVLKWLLFMLAVYGVLFYLAYLEMKPELERRDEEKERENRRFEARLRGPDSDDIFDKTGPVNKTLEKLGYYD